MRRNRTQGGASRSPVYHVVLRGRRPWFQSDPGRPYLEIRRAARLWFCALKGLFAAECERGHEYAPAPAGSQRCTCPRLMARPAISRVAAAAMAPNTPSAIASGLLARSTCPVTTDVT